MANDTTRQRRTDKEENITRPPEGGGTRILLLFIFFLERKSPRDVHFFTVSVHGHRRRRRRRVVKTVCCWKRAFFFRAQFSTFIVQGLRRRVYRRDTVRVITTGIRLFEDRSGPKGDRIAQRVGISRPNTRRTISIFRIRIKYVYNFQVRSVILQTH